MNLEFIKQHEGLRLDAYIDPVGVPTIGYGTIRYEDGSRVKIGDKITMDRAERLLKDDAERRWNAIKHTIKVPINDNQKTALVSLVYNIGVGAFINSTLLKRINQKMSENSIRDAFRMWSKGRVDGKLVTLKGLLRRREDECDLYFS